MRDNLKSKKRLPWLLLLGIVIFVGLFILWWGVPTYQQWRADRLVDELCAKDGGYKVYGNVVLPSSMFNKYGQPEISQSKNSSQSRSGLYYQLNIEDLVGNHDSAEISQLVVMRTRGRLIRLGDHEVLGEIIRYTRTGGGPIGPWHPSSYTCPANLDIWDLAAIVVKRKGGN